MLRPKVFVSAKLPGGMENLLRGNFDVMVNENDSLSRQELLDLARDKDAIVCNLVNKIDEAFLDACPSIKLVSNVAVGYDNIDLAAAKTRGVLVCNTPGVLTETTADLAFALLLAVARRVPESEQFLKEGRWKSFALDLLLGVDVHHKTLGIIGFGRIGQAFARRASGFSMKILYSQNSRAEASLEERLSASFVSLEELLKQSDFVSIHCPLNEKTKNLIAADQFKIMKPGAVLINTARGAIVDEEALADALEAGIISGAGLDVYSKEPEIPERLKAHKNVVLLPHIGSATIETRAAMGKMAVEAVIESFSGKRPCNLLNAECWEHFLNTISSQDAIR